MVKKTELKEEWAIKKYNEYLDKNPLIVRLKILTTPHDPETMSVSSLLFNFLHFQKEYFIMSKILKEKEKQIEDLKSKIEFIKKRLEISNS